MIYVFKEVTGTPVTSLHDELDSLLLLVLMCFYVIMICECASFVTLESLKITEHCNDKHEKPGQKSNMFLCILCQC